MFLFSHPHTIWVLGSSVDFCFLRKNLGGWPIYRAASQQYWPKIWVAPMLRNCSGIWLMLFSVIIFSGFNSFAWMVLQYFSLLKCCSLLWCSLWASPDPLSDLASYLPLSHCPILSFLLTYFASLWRSSDSTVQSMISAADWLLIFFSSTICHSHTLEHSNSFARLSAPQL